ncbi:MAG: L-threonylcarbamoyladenylate synthase [Pirellulaceae bacterium]|nr:L-threonylcarbamoyladenylate synthase [Pirellulaceae bacterium]
MALVVTPTPENLLQAAQRIRAGRLVAFATETVYGLGADALNPAAVASVFELKGRPLFDPLIVHVSSTNQAQKLCSQWPVTADKLAARFWPGPLTMVLPRADLVPDLVTAGLPNVALRWPAHPVAQQLIRLADCPIAAPSANRFASISPTSAADVASELTDPDLWILDGGPCQHGLESTVISLVSERPIVLRFGSLAVEDLEAELGPLTIAVRSVNQAELQSGLASPGHLSRHYSPRTPLLLIEPDEFPPTIATHQRVGLLCFGDQASTPLTPHFAVVENLSVDADLREAATRLYAALRKLDQANLDLIVALALPAVGLGRAINDRLQRASH